MFAITLDKNGKEHKKEELSDGQVPKFGFQRKKDGNFYKQLGDPRCVSDEHKRKFLLEQQKEKEKKQQESATVPISTAIQKVNVVRSIFSSNQINDNNDNKILSKVYHAKKPITSTEFKIKIVCGTTTETPSEIIMMDVMGAFELPFEALNSLYGFRKIVVKKDAGVIMAWKVNALKKHPDIVICKAII